MRCARLCVTSLLLLSLTTTIGGAPAETAVREGVVAAAHLQQVVDELKRALGLAAEVGVVVVDDNPRLVSVSRHRGTPGAFVMAFQRSFLMDLNRGELRAVIAHELGHVWIFGNHPYLHTEQLANQIALRVVDRAALESAYRKVQALGGPGAIQALP